MIITKYLMILLILMKLIVVNSLHRDYMVLYGIKWRWMELNWLSYHAL